MTTNNGSQIEVAETESAWTLRSDVIEALGRSAPTMVADRLCDACRSAVASTPPAELTFDALRAKVRTHCGDQAGYIEPHQPVQETAFRILLASSDPSMRLSILHRRIIDLWSSSSWPRHITAEALERVLDHGQHTGIDRAAT